MRGKLIVFEGTDGSGKATQSRLLCAELERRGSSFRKIDFPRYGQPSAAMVQAYLDGQLGSRPGDVNAYAASLFYAVDRYASYKQDWGNWYETGGLVVTDRYTTSNAVHQAGKLPDGACQDYLRWLFHFEYDLMGLPRPDLVIYLDLPAELSAALRRQREESTGQHADIHEADAAYLRRCRENALRVVAFDGWRRIDCSRDGAIRTPEEIHREVWSLVAPLLERE